MQKKYEITKQLTHLVGNYYKFAICSIFLVNLLTVLKCRQNLAPEKSSSQQDKTICTTFLFLLPSKNVFELEGDSKINFCFKFKRGLPKFVQIYKKMPHIKFSLDRLRILA